MVATPKPVDTTSALARDLYDNVIKHELSDDQLGMYLAIDVKSGDYEIGADGLDTALTLRKRRPDGRIFGMIHGSYTTGSIGYAPPTPGSCSLVE